MSNIFIFGGVAKKKKIVHWMDSILYNGVFIKVSLFIVHESSILR